MATKGDLSRMYRNFSGSKGPQDFMSKADVDAAIAAIPAGGGKLYSHMMVFKDSTNADTVMYAISPNAEAPATFDDAVTLGLASAICNSAFMGRNVLSLIERDDGYDLFILTVSDGPTAALAVTSVAYDAAITDTVFDLSTLEPVTPDEDSN